MTLAPNKKSRANDAPHFASASRLTRENALKDDLRYLRVQIAVFRAQHRDVPPGYPAGNAVDGNTGNFTHTANTANGYWMADLGRAVPLDRIEIDNGRLP